MDNRTQALGITLAIILSGCSVDDPEPSEVCETGHCDDLAFLDQLKGREDPIAQWLRAQTEAGVIDVHGTYHPDLAGGVAPTDESLLYPKLMAGLIAVQGCAANSQENYTVSDELVGPGVFPRLVSTVCAGDTTRVANAFVATVGTASDDLVLDDLEMFAWDATQNRYFFYATQQGNPTKLEVEPARCSECHTTPRDLDPINPKTTQGIEMPRLPIMNELTKPWTHWNAGVGGVSDNFHVPDELHGKPNWERYGATSAAASRLQAVIQSVNTLRIAMARSQKLFAPVANLEQAMGLLRPVFCDEQVNYVSELATGEISRDAVIGGGTKNAFGSIRNTWPFAWFNNDNIHLPATTSDQRLFMVPVRGFADVSFETTLHTALTPANILAVRALDWKTPVFSQFRCGLWRDAWDAFKLAPPALSGRNSNAVRVLFDEIMKRGGMTTRNLANGRFVALDVATDASIAALRAAVAAGTIPTACGADGFCELDADGFGGLLQTYVDSLATPAGRVQLTGERNVRACTVVSKVDPIGAHKELFKFKRDARFGNHPSFLRIQNDEPPVSTLPTNCNP